MNLNSPREIVWTSLHESKELDHWPDKAADNAIWALFRQGYVILRVDDPAASREDLEVARKALDEDLDPNRGAACELVTGILELHHEMFPKSDRIPRCSCGWHATNVTMSHVGHVADELVSGIREN